MKTVQRITRLIIIAALLIPFGNGAADEIRVATASNFTTAIKAITQRFEMQTGHKVIPVFGSTGKHYAQIMNGAPFDVFLAADVHHPRLLEEAGVALPGSRFTYAMGRIVLWSPRQGYVDAAGKRLENSDFQYLAIANPRLAPYGKAAREVLTARGLWEQLSGRMVRGENIGQTFQFVVSGNAELGFVAWSQIKRPGHQPTGSYWEIPRTLYSPIAQQAVLLKENPVAEAFLDFIKGNEARAIIKDYGYGTP